MTVRRNFLCASFALLAATLLTLQQARAETRPPAIDGAHKITPEAIAQFIGHYYKAPTPEAVPAVIAAALASGLLEQQSRRMALIGFMAGLIRTDPTMIDRLAPLFEALPNDHSMRLVRAIIYSGRPDWSLHTARLKNLWPVRAAEIEALAAKGGRAIPALKVDGNTVVLDMNWAFFGATGDIAAVLKVISALPTPLDGSDPKLLLSAQAAKWSLTSNAALHPRVLATCRDGLGGPHAEQLKDVIAAAEARLARPPTSRPKGSNPTTL